MESDLLIRMALCLNPDLEAAKGVSEKALRSLGIDAGNLLPRERQHRENRRLKLKAELVPLKDGEEMRGVIPGLAQKLRPTEYAVPIPWAGLSIIAEKIARGCEYKLKGKKFVEPPYAEMSGINIYRSRLAALRRQLAGTQFRRRPARVLAHSLMPIRSPMKA